MNILNHIEHFRADDCVYNKHGTLGPRIQTGLELFYIYRGSARVEIDGVERRVGAGRVTLLTPGHVEWFRFSEREPTHHGYGVIGGGSVPERMASEPEALGRVYSMTPRIREVTEWAKTLERDETPSGRALQCELVRVLFMEFFRIAGYPERPEPLPPEPFRRARSFVDDHYAEEIDLERIAAAAGVTPAHTIRLFRRFQHETPIRYLWRVRTSHGARMLVETGLSIAEIAYRCGFRAPYHFARLIRKRTGVTPREYRARQWRIAE
ncbi:AraC family transcriptional regulator [Kiritimatiella glycovorans]|uniref:AraC family transcriptional regulator n=1 Tax=Kiritimatiella glycovorans TaxID=1307763 RepID=A0A0G3EAT7_9BACT|nr:AraC family transcriptional regulator [Kiritimatiella glycovorans]AKJ63601.1 AraC family transcriptional regulator [Kiritimatiella glycovorans]